MLLTRLIGHGQVVTAVERSFLLLDKWASTMAQLVESSLVALLTGDVARRHPVCAGPRLESLNTVHHVHIFERQSTRLVQEEVYDDTGNGVRGEEDESIGVGDAVVGKRGEETDEDCG